MPCEEKTRLAIVYISALRSKVDRDFPHKLIQPTVASATPFTYMNAPPRRPRSTPTAPPSPTKLILNFVKQWNPSALALADGPRARSYFSL
jgi:hypothetical protein